MSQTRIILISVPESRRVEHSGEWLATEAPSRGDEVTIGGTTYAVTGRRWAMKRNEGVVCFVYLDHPVPAMHEADPPYHNLL